MKMDTENSNNQSENTTGNSDPSEAGQQNRTEHGGGCERNTQLDTVNTPHKEPGESGEGQHLGIQPDGSGLEFQRLTDTASEQKRDESSLQGSTSHKMAPANKDEAKATVTDSVLPKTPKNPPDVPQSSAEASVANAGSEELAFDANLDNYLQSKSSGNSPMKNCSQSKEPLTSPTKCSRKLEHSSHSLDDLTEIGQRDVLSFFSVLNEPHSARVSDDESQENNVSASFEMLNDNQNDPCHLPDLNASAVSTPSDVEQTKPAVSTTKKTAQIDSIGSETGNLMAVETAFELGLGLTDIKRQQSKPANSKDTGDTTHEPCKTATDSSKHVQTNATQKSSEKSIELAKNVFTVNVSNELCSSPGLEQTQLRALPCEITHIADGKTPQNVETTTTKAHISHSVNNSAANKSDNNNSDIGESLTVNKSMSDNTNLDNVENSTANNSVLESESVMESEQADQTLSANNSVLSEATKSADISLISEGTVSVLSEGVADVESIAKTGHALTTPNATTAQVQLSDSCEDMGFKISNVVSLFENGEKDGNVMQILDTISAKDTSTNETRENSKQRNTDLQSAVPRTKQLTVAKSPSKRKLKNTEVNKNIANTGLSLPSALDLTCTNVMIDNLPLNLSVESSPTASDNRTTPVESHFYMEAAASVVSPVSHSTASSPGVASNRSISPHSVTVTRSDIKNNPQKERVNKRKRKEPVRSRNYKEVEYVDVTDSFQVPATSLLEPTEIKQEKVDTPVSDFFDTRAFNPSSLAPPSPHIRTNITPAIPQDFMLNSHTVHHHSNRMPRPTLHVIEPEGFNTAPHPPFHGDFHLRSNFPPHNNFMSNQLQRFANTMNNNMFRSGNANVILPMPAPPRYPVNLHRPFVPQPINIAPEMPNGSMFHNFARNTLMNNFQHHIGRPNMQNHSMQFNPEFMPHRMRPPRQPFISPRPIAIVPTVAQQAKRPMPVNARANELRGKRLQGIETGVSTANKRSWFIREKSPNVTVEKSAHASVANKTLTNKRAVVMPSTAPKRPDNLQTVPNKIVDPSVVSSEILKRKYPTYKATQPPDDLEFDTPFKQPKCLGCGDVFLFSSSLFDHINRKSMKIEYNCVECKEVKVFWNRCTLFIHAKGHAKGAKAYRLNINNAVIKVLPDEFMPVVVDKPSDTGRHLDKNADKSAKATTGESVEQSGTTPTTHSLRPPTVESVEQSGTTPTTHSLRPPTVEKDCATAKNSATDRAVTRGSVQSPIEIPDSPGSNRSLKEADSLKGSKSNLDSINPLLMVKNKHNALRCFNYNTDIRLNQIGIHCIECKAFFASIELYTGHFTGIGYGSTPESSALTKCHTCGLEMRSMCAFKAHQRIHQKTSPYVCPECGELISGERSVFLKHLTQRCLHFQRSLLMRCTVCNIVILFDSNTVTSHYLDHHNTKYFKCTNCRMAFKTEATWMTHRDDAHKGIKGTKCKMICKCSLCDTVYHDIHSVNLHFQKEHFPNLGESSSFVAFKCIHCHPQKLFNSRSSYASHIFQVHKRRVVNEMCNSCGWEAVTSSELHQHFESTHPNTLFDKLADDTCETTDESDDDKTNEQTSPEQALKTSTVKSPPSIKIYKCDICNTLLRNAPLFDKHMEKHRLSENRKNSGEKVLSLKLKKTKNGSDESDTEFQVVNLAEENSGGSQTSEKTDSPNDKKEKSTENENTSNEFGKPQDGVVTPRNKNNPFKVKRKFAGSYVELNDPKTNRTEMKSPVVKVKNEFMGQVPTAPAPKPRFSCSECTERFHTQPLLREHLKMKHGIAPQFPCHLCGNTYDSANQVARHIATVHEGKAKGLPYWCWVCMEHNVNKGYPSWKMLEKHLISAHKVHKNHIDYSKFVRHYSSQNGLEDEGKSETGSEANKRAADLDMESDVPVKRLKTSGDSVFNCAKCAFTVESRKLFARHIIKHKTDDTDMQCMECGLCFTVLPAVKRHLFMVHKIKDLDKYRRETGIDLESVESQAIGRGAAFSDVTGSPFKSQIPNGIKASNSQKKKVNKSPRERTPETEGDPLVTLQCNVCYKSFEDATKVRSHMRMHGMAFIRSRRSELSKAKATV